MSNALTTLSTTRLALSALLAGLDTRDACRVHADDATLYISSAHSLVSVPAESSLSGANGGVAMNPHLLHTLLSRTMPGELLAWSVTPDELSMSCGSFSVRLDARTGQAAHAVPEQLPTVPPHSLDGGVAGADLLRVARCTTDERGDWAHLFFHAGRVMASNGQRIEQASGAGLPEGEPIAVSGQHLADLLDSPALRAASIAITVRDDVVHFSADLGRCVRWAAWLPVLPSILPDSLAALADEGGDVVAVLPALMHPDRPGKACSLARAKSAFKATSVGLVGVLPSGGWVGLSLDGAHEWTGQGMADVSPLPGQPVVVLSPAVALASIGGGTLTRSARLGRYIVRDGAAVTGAAGVSVSGYTYPAQMSLSEWQAVRAQLRTAYLTRQAERLAADLKTAARNGEALAELMARYSLTRHEAGLTDNVVDVLRDILAGLDAHAAQRARTLARTVTAWAVRRTTAQTTRERVEREAVTKAGKPKPLSKKVAAALADADRLAVTAWDDIDEAVATWGQVYLHAAQVRDTLAAMTNGTPCHVTRARNLTRRLVARLRDGQTLLAIHTRKQAALPEALASLERVKAARWRAYLRGETPAPAPEAEPETEAPPLPEVIEQATPAPAPAPLNICPSADWGGHLSRWTAPYLATLAGVQRHRALPPRWPDPLAGFRWHRALPVAEVAPLPAPPAHTRYTRHPARSAALLRHRHGQRWHRALIAARVGHLEGLAALPPAALLDLGRRAAQGDPLALAAARSAALVLAAAGQPGHGQPWRGRAGLAPGATLSRPPLPDGPPDPDPVALPVPQLVAAPAAPPPTRPTVVPDSASTSGTAPQVAETQVQGAQGWMVVRVWSDGAVVLTHKGQTWPGRVNERGHLSCPGTWVQVAGRQSLAIRARVLELARALGVVQ